MPAAGEILFDGQRLALDQVDQLVGEHGRLALALQAQVDGGRGAIMQVEGGPQLLVTELLRLAHLGALTEQAWRDDPTRRVFTVINAAASRWRHEHGVI